MAAAFGTFTIILGDNKYEVDVKTIDAVRAERALQKSVQKFDGIGDMFALAWAAMRRLKIDGVPDTFDAFLDLDPDIDLDEINAQVELASGKDSGQGPSTGPSSS